MHLQSLGIVFSQSGFTGTAIVTCGCHANILHIFQTILHLDGELEVFGR